MTLIRRAPAASIIIVIFAILDFVRYAHAQDVSGPVCKWNNSTSTCEKDPSKMIELLTKSNDIFGHFMRCQYAFEQSTCNNMSTICIWENNACRISSKILISYINFCFFEYNFQNEINKPCKNELQNISKNITWIDKESVLPAYSCEDIDYSLFNYSIYEYMSIYSTCQLIEDSLRCSPYYSSHRCSYGSTDMQAYQLVSDMRYIMGVSSMNVSIGLYYLERYLDIEYGNLQLYDKCNNIKSSYYCECSISKYQYCPSSDSSPSPSDSYRSSGSDDGGDINFAIIIVPIVLFKFIFCAICCARIKAENGTLFVDRNSENVQVATRAQTIDRTSQNVQLAARTRTTIEAQTSNLETSETLEIIRHLPQIEYKDQKGHENSEAICCICLLSLKEGDPSTFLPCAHWFHKKCLIKWIRTKGKNVACPLCNTPIQNTNGNTIQNTNRNTIQNTNRNNEHNNTIQNTNRNNEHNNTIQNTNRNNEHNNTMQNTNRNNELTPEEPMFDR